MDACTKVVRETSYGTQWMLDPFVRALTQVNGQTKEAVRPYRSEWLQGALTYALSAFVFYRMAQQQRDQTEDGYTSNAKQHDRFEIALFPR